MAILAIAVRAERVAKEVEGLAAGIPNRGLRFVESEPQFGHQLLRPRQSLSRRACLVPQQGRWRIQHPDENFSDIITLC
jgi:hypothetical protein